MKRSKPLLFITSLLLLSTLWLWVSCDNGHDISNKFFIHGKLKNTNANKVVLVQMSPDSLNPIDSAVISDEGEFSFTHEPSDFGFYLLKLSNDNFITLLLGKGETVMVFGDSRQLANDYQVSGSLGTSLLWELNQVTRNNVKKTDSLHQVKENHRDSTNFLSIKAITDSIYLNIFIDQQDFVKSFIKKNHTSLASLYALYQVFGRQPVLNEQEHYSYFALIDSSLHFLYPENVFVKELHDRMISIKEQRQKLQIAESKLQAGMPAPDIQLMNVGGISRSLSSFHGSLTLLFFWTSNNQASLKVMKSLRWMHKQYGARGFKIYAVSLDTKRTEWEGCIREQHVLWENVSDLLGWESPVVSRYALQYIPYAILIDTDGNIVQKGINEVEIASYLFAYYKF